jgi:protein-S-isoprenylcysteine O-methyltransferase Ste14
MVETGGHASLRSAWLQSLAALGVVGVVLFGCAGTVAVPEFWWYLLAFAAMSVAGLLGIDPDLAAERMRPGGKRPSHLYILIPLFLIGHLAIAGLDRGRFHWSDTVPLAVEIMALVLFAASGFVVAWAMHVNRFFSSVPRIQSERGHVVISAGPYRWVRHPGYTAGIVLAITSGLALGSWLATVISALGVPLLLYRTVIEDKLLQEQLPGYREYAARVRYRLVPGGW